jgi:hypothetical protein
MSYHLMPCHISTVKYNSENSRKLPHSTSHFSIKNNSKTSRKIYYNSLRIINGEFSQHASMPHHLMSHHISPLKIILKTIEKYFFKLIPQK